LDKETFTVLVKDLAIGSPLYTSYLHADEDLIAKFGEFISIEV
jgi:hypothetical protein